MRSLIAQPDKYSKWIGNILEELEDAYKLDPERYREEMLPYLRDHDAIWRAHAMSTGLDNARLRPLLEYAPFLRFRTELYDFEDLGRLDMFDAIDRIVSVTMGDFRDDPYVDWEWFGSLPWKELGRLDLINFGVEPRGVRKGFSSGRLSTLEDLCLSYLLSEMGDLNLSCFQPVFVAGHFALVSIIIFKVVDFILIGL